MSHSKKEQMRKGVLLTEEALAKLQAERIAIVQMHWDEVAKRYANRDMARDLVLKAELERNGVPDSEEGRLALFERCDAMARLISDKRLTASWEAKGEVLKALNVRDVPPHIEWAAAQLGVKLVPDVASPGEAVVDAAPTDSKLVVAH